MEAEANTQIITSKRKTGPDAQTHASHTKSLQRQKEYFDSQPKEKVTIRKADGPQWVQINGYAFSIRATGEPVDVPRDVANALRRKGVA